MDQPIRLREHDVQVLVMLIDRQVAPAAPQHVDEPPDPGERGSELVTGDGDEVGLHLVEFPEPLDRRLLVSPEPRGFEHQAELIGETLKHFVAFGTRCGVVPRPLVDRSDDLSADDHRNDGVRGRDHGRSFQRGRRERRRRREQPVASEVAGIAVYPVRHESHLARRPPVPNQDAERVAPQLLGDRLRRGLQRRRQPIHVGLRERGRMERCDLTPGLPFSRRRLLGSRRGGLGIVGPACGHRGLAARQRRERPRDRSDHERHPGAERDRRRVRLHRRSGDRHPDLGQQLPDEERGCP